VATPAFVSPPQTPNDRLPEIWLFDEARIMGGGQVFALRLGRHLAEAGGPAMRLVAPAGSELQGLLAGTGIEHVAASYPALGLRGSPQWPGAIARLRRLLREMPPDAIAVGNGPRAQAFLFAASAGLRSRPPVVQVVHETDTVARATGRFAYAHGGPVLAFGERNAAACRARLRGTTVHQANLFLDWPRVPVSRNEAPSAEPVLGVLARFIAGKGQLALLEELAGAQGWSRAVFAGPHEDSQLVAQLRARVTELGLEQRIEIRDSVGDVPGFFAEIEVLVVPTTESFEGQAMVIIEALSQNRPALVRRMVFSPGDYAGLPVTAYDGAVELEAALGALDRKPVDQELLRSRFSAEQALAAILAAAGERG
jgi:glycosyltransferase involved in cell wall biosynthesis